jgi:hypothetical protein
VDTGTQKSLKNRYVRERKLHVGDNVKVLKKGTQTGKVGTVTDPDWNGRVKLRMNKTGDVKSYLIHEIMVIRVHDDDHSSSSPKHKDAHKQQHHHHHHHHHHYHFNTAASGFFSFCNQCWYHIFCVGHSDHEDHDDGDSPTEEDPIEWRKSAFMFGRVELTFRVVQALSLIQALFTLWSVLHFGEMLTVTPYADTKLIVSFGLSALVLLILISGFVMPALFESYTLLQAWCVPTLGLIDECRYRVKARETAVLELIKRFRRRVQLAHITKEAMRKIFDELDVDNSGSLDRNEISELLVDIFGNISRVRMAHLIKLFDPLGAGCTYDMFVKVLYDGNTAQLSHQIVEQETKRELMRRKSSLTRKTSKLLRWFGTASRTVSKRGDVGASSPAAVELTEIVVPSKNRSSSVTSDEVDGFDSADDVLGEA